MTETSEPIGVLLVDDSPAILAGLGRLIEGEAPRLCLVGRARSREEALAGARLGASVIVMDLVLEGCSSLELIPELLRHAHGRVLIHTGLGDRRLHEDAMLFGALGVVSKTTSAAQVLEAIECVHGGAFWNLDPPTSAVVNLHRGASGLDFLSPAELDLIVHIVGRWHGAIAAPLPMSAILGGLVSIYNKLGLRNRAELVRFAIEHRLVDYGEAAPPMPAEAL